MSGKVYAFMTATAVEIRPDDENESIELNGWIDQDWSMVCLNDSRNDVQPLVNEWQDDTEELTEAVRDVLGDGSLWDDNGDGTFYSQQSRIEDGMEYTYAVHFHIRDSLGNETDWHPETDGGIVLKETASV